MLDTETRTKIFNLVVRVVENKLKKKPKDKGYNPFMDVFFTDPSIIPRSTFIHSLYTSIGMSIYEQVAIILAQRAGYECYRQYRLSGFIDTETSGLIADLMESPGNKAIHVDQVRSTIKPSDGNDKSRDRVVDVYVKRPDGVELLFDITTVKPSKKEFDALRLKMMKWCALRFSTDPKAQVETYIGIPFNPYQPHAYDYWTADKAGVDRSEILIQEALWEKFAGYNVFPELESILMDAGHSLKGRVEEYLGKLK